MYLFLNWFAIHKETQTRSSVAHKVKLLHLCRAKHLVWCRCRSFFFFFLQFHRRHDCKCAKKSFHFNTTNAIRAVEYQPSLLTTCSPFLPSCVNKATGSELLFYLQKCENIKYCICIGQEKQVIIVYRYQLKKKIRNRMLEMGCKALRWPLFKNRIIWLVLDVFKKYPYMFLLWLKHSSLFIWS